MKALILYDSTYGNTEKVAQAMAKAMPSIYQVDVLPLKDTHITDIITSDLIIVGSPTQAGRPTVALQHYLANLPTNVLGGIRVAAFDTRFEPANHGFWLRKLMRFIGFAANPIAKLLQSKHGTLVVPPEGFIVQDKTGPLKQGELKRAEFWAKDVAQHYS
ncbi:MAG TPA: flavodoxin family protein [Candidatus Saccharimonadales bacterium]|nr:flavodoxin family protein [Candidatus Saccharimonadales bacterium]